MGLYKAILDATHGEDDRIGGRPVTQLTAPLTEDGTTAVVESTVGFQPYRAIAPTVGRLLVGDEVVEGVIGDSQFTSLQRALEGSTAKLHPVGTLVYDYSGNASALGRVRRGLFVDFAESRDLNVLGRNLGLRRCPGLTDEQWRRLTKVMGYLPKQPIDAYEQVLDAFYDGDTSKYRVYERLGTASPDGEPIDPYTVYVEIDTGLATSLMGRFYLNGGEQQETTGTNTVETNREINHVIGVFDDTPSTRGGFRDGLTNYFTGGSFTGSTITLGSSPGAAGTPVIIDYGAFKAHYLAKNETIVQGPELDRRWPYLSSPFSTLSCLLEQVRGAGTRIVFRTKGT